MSAGSSSADLPHSSKFKSNSALDASEKLSAEISAAKALCWATFLGLGNYFALVGIFYAEKAVKLAAGGDLAGAGKSVKTARRWVIWGLVPSTVINAAIVYVCVIFLLHLWETIKAVS